ncbi:hypothetical protein [Rosistilla oblonga]|uniref:hypothetical protein n=1 Tax=Rosistilla oblonga TaxID=2527990 RepID=UPI003A977524
MSSLWLPGMDPLRPIPTGKTLAIYFTEAFLPAMVERRLSRDRIGELEQAVHRWNWWCTEGCNPKDRTSRPVLADITPPRLTEFKKAALGAELPGRDGKLRVVSPRSLNKTLQALEQILSAAVEDGTLDEARGMMRIRKVEQPAQIGKLVMSDAQLGRLMEAAADATWPYRTTAGQAIEAPLFWQAAIALFSTYGMRTQDLVRYDQRMMPIRWGGIFPAGLSPAEDGTLESSYGWIAWVPNKTRSRKVFSMCLPLTKCTAYWLDQWRTSCGRVSDSDPVFGMPNTKDSFYDQWSRIVTAADVRPKPRVAFDDNGNVQKQDREFKIKHLRCTAGTRADEHGATLGYENLGRWVTGHVSNDVFNRHYRSQEKPIMRTLESLPMPAEFTPTGTGGGLRVFAG